MAITRTAMIDDDGSGTTGTILNNAWKQTLYAEIDAFVGAGGTWTGYIPGWTGHDGTGPTIGNGITEGKYMQIGKWITFSAIFIAGTTTTYGNSTLWRLTLPFAPKTNPSILHPQQLNFHAAVVQNTGAIFSGWTAFLLTHGTTTIYACNAAGALWGPTVPFTWTTNCLFSVRGTYELP